MIASNKGRLHVYSSGATAPPLKRIAEEFKSRFKTKFDFTIDKAENLISQIVETKEGDVLSCGAEYMLDDAAGRGLIVRSSTKSVGFRRSVILVPIGNPKRIESLHDLTRNGIRVGIATGGCLLGVWDDVCSKAGLTDKIRKNITDFAGGCGEVVGLVNQKKVDASFGWNAFKNLWPKNIDVIEIPRELQVHRSTGVAVIRFSKNRELASKFIDFLTSKEGRMIYAEYGWSHNRELGGSDK